MTWKTGGTLPLVYCWAQVLKTEFNADPYVVRPQKTQGTLFQSSELLNVGCSSSYIIHALHIVLKIVFYNLINGFNFFLRKKEKS